MRRATAFFLAVLINFPGVTYAAPSINLSASEPAAEFEKINLLKVSIPKAIGNVQEKFEGRSEKTVFIIQDAHEIPDAQRSIQKLIDFLQKQYGVRLVALEGAASDLDAQIFKSFPDQNLLKKVFDQYFDEGELAGGTAAALFNTTPSIYHGIEDWGLYEEGLKQFLDSMEIEGGVTDRLRELFAQIKTEKEKHYTPELLQIDIALQAFRENGSDLADVLQKLASVRPPEKGSELALILEGIGRPKENQQAIGIQVKKIAIRVESVLKQKLSDGAKQDLVEFNQKFQEFQQGAAPEAFALFLKNLSIKHRIRVKVSKQLNYLVSNQKRIKDIEGTKFFDDFQKYAQSVKVSLFKNDEEKQIDAQSRRLELMERLAKLELSREDWNEVKEIFNENQYWKKEKSGADREEILKLLETMRPQVSFYHNAGKRDAAFMEKVESLFREQKTKSAVFIAGGFHAEGVTYNLKSKGISYVLVMPQMNQVPDQTHYRDHMKGEVSWGNYFEDENGKVDLYSAFVRGTRDQLLKLSKEDRGKILKAWRDQILRDLAQKGKLADSKEYTRFIDEMAGESSGNKEWEKNITHFMDGLRDLRDRGNLTEENIAKLFQPASIPTGATAAPLAKSKLRTGLLPRVMAVREAKPRRNAVEEKAGLELRAEIRRISQLESMKVPNGKRGLWAGGVDLAKKRQMENFKRSITAGQPVKTGNGIEFIVDRSRFSEEEAAQIETILQGIIHGLSPADLAALAEQQRARGEGLKPIVITKLDDAQSLFADHTANGFMGVHRKLFDPSVPKDTILKILNIGLSHEVKHEALIRERKALDRRLQRNENEPRLSAAEVKSKMTKVLQQAVEGELYEEDLDLAADIGLARSELDSLIKAGAMSETDGFSEGLKFHGDSKLRSRHREFFEKHDAEHHLIDGIDPEFHEVYDSVREVFERLLEAAGLDPKFYRLYLSDENSPNAFYLRGSNAFVVTLGLLRLLSVNGEIALSKDAIAFVLAHEIQHLRQYREDVFKDKVDPNMDLTESWTIMTDERKQQYLDEYDADWNAVDLMSRAGLNVREAPQVFRALLQLIRNSEGKSIYLPFGSHPQLEPRTLELENLVLRRYWPNASKPVSSFGDLKVPTSRFRDFQKRVYAMKSDEEFAQLIMEAKDVRELSIVIAVGKSRRAQQDYRHNPDLMTEEGRGIKALADLQAAIEAKVNMLTKQTDEEGFLRLEREIQELITDLSLPDFIIPIIRAGTNTELFTFTSDGSGVGSSGQKLPWRGESSVYFMTGPAAGRILRLEDGRIVMIRTGERIGNFVDIVDLQTHTASRENIDIFFGAKYVNINLNPATLTDPQAPLEATSRRTNGLKSENPSRKLQLEFFEEMFRKFLFRSERFSPRRIETTREDSIFSREKVEKQKALADPAEFDAFVRSASNEDLLNSLEDLNFIWIEIEDMNGEAERLYENLKRSLRGYAYGTPAYPRGDYFEFIDAAAREIRRRVEEGSAPLDTILKLIAVLEKMNPQGIAEDRDRMKLSLFNFYIENIQASQENLSRDSTLALLDLLDRLKFLAGAHGGDEIKRMQQSVGQLVYKMYRNSETRNETVALFRKHEKIRSGVKDRFYELLSEETGLDLNQKFEIIDELGRDGAGFFHLKKNLMEAAPGEAGAYVSKIIAEIAAKQPGLAALTSVSETLKRVMVVLYLGAGTLNSELLFQFLDTASRQFLLSADEIRLFRDFIHLGLADKSRDWRYGASVIAADKKNQLLLFLNIFEFLKSRRQDASIFRFLLSFNAGEALGEYDNFKAYMYINGGYDLTPEGVQHEKDMRTFSLLLGELVDRQADSENRYLPGLSSTPPDEGYTVTQMIERLAGSRPQRFGRWDLMQEGDKDLIDFFSFLAPIYSGSNFQEAAADLADHFPESRLRDLMIYALFIQKILREKLGIDINGDKIFDFEWIRTQIQEKGIPVHEEIQVLLGYLGWDRDIQKINVRFLGEIHTGNQTLSVDPAVYEQEKSGYSDLAFYDIGGVNAQLGLAVASLDETYLRDFLGEDHPLEEKLRMLLQYYPKTSAYRDQFIKQILDETLKALESGALDLNADIETQLLRALKAFQNLSMREKFAVKSIEAALAQIQKQKGSLSLEDERAEVLKYLPDYSYMRDEVINQLVRRHIKEAGRRYDEFSSLLVQNPENIRNRETEEHLFWKEQLSIVMMNFSVYTKTKFLLWLMGQGEKPAEVMEVEYRLHVSFDGFKDSMGLYQGEFYSGIGKRDQQEFFNSFFLGDKGIFANEYAYKDFLDGIIGELIPENRKAVRQLFETILKTDNLQRRQRILMGLLRNFGQLQDIQDPEVKEAKSIRAFLEAYGFIGVKLGQFLAHSALVRPGSPLQKELSELNDSVEPMDVGILIDMLKKIYGPNVFEEHFEYLGDLLGSASIKVVHKAKRKNGEEVVIKFKRPEIEKQIEEELVFFESLLYQFAPMLEQEGIPVPAGLVRRLKEIFDEELNFGDEHGKGEAANQKRIKQNIESRKTKERDGVTYEFSVPNGVEVHENSVMIEEFAGGIPLKKDAALRENGIEPETVKELLMEELLQQFFFDGFYHADLHSGNVLIQKMENNKIGIHLIDLGAAAEISSKNREMLVAILMALWDNEKWESNKEVIHRFFPQIQGMRAMENELNEIAASDRNPIQKLLLLFALLEKNNIEFQEDYRQFYSVIRFLKASEYLFSENMLQKMKERFMPSNFEEMKSKALAITAEIQKEFAQIPAPVLTDSGGATRITLSMDTINQVYGALLNLENMPFWPMLTATFPQVSEISNLLIGGFRFLIQQGKNVELVISAQEKPFYEELKQDVDYLAGLISQGSVGPMGMFGALAAVRRIAGHRDHLIDFILNQNLPMEKIFDSIMRIAGTKAEKRIRDLFEARQKARRPAGVSAAGSSGQQNLVGNTASVAALVIEILNPEGNRTPGRPEIRQIYELSVSDLDAFTQAIEKNWAERGQQAAAALQNDAGISQSAVEESEKLLAHLRAPQVSAPAAEGSVTLGVRLTAEENNSFLVQLFKALGAISERAEILVEADAVKSISAGERANADIRPVKPMDWKRGFQALRSGQENVPVALDLNIMKEQMEGMFSGIRLDWGNEKPGRIVEDYGELLMAVTLIEMARIYANPVHQQALAPLSPKMRAKYLKTQLLLRLTDLGYSPEMFSFGEDGLLTIQGTLAKAVLEMKAREAAQKAA